MLSDNTMLLLSPVEGKPGGGCVFFFGDGGCVGVATVKESIKSPQHEKTEHRRRGVIVMGR